MKNNDFTNNEILLWNRFDNYAENRDYKVIVHNDSNMGRSSTAFKQDEFKPIIIFHLFGTPFTGYDIGILVKDRNGNSILDGEFAGAYTLNALPETDYKKLESRLDKMLKYVFDKYGQYSKSNRLDFVFNELEEERIKF